MGDLKGSCRHLYLKGVKYHPRGWGAGDGQVPLGSRAGAGQGMAMRAEYPSPNVRPTSKGDRPWSHRSGTGRAVEKRWRWFFHFSPVEREGEGERKAAWVLAGGGRRLSKERITLSAEWAEACPGHRGLSVLARRGREAPPAGALEQGRREWESRCWHSRPITLSPSPALHAPRGGQWQENKTSASGCWQRHERDVRVHGTRFSSCS